MRCHYYGGGEGWYLLPGRDTASLGVTVNTNESGLCGTLTAPLLRVPGNRADRGRPLTGLGGDVVQDGGQRSGLSLPQQVSSISSVHTDSFHVEQEVLVAREVGPRAELLAVLPLVLHDLAAGMDLSGAPGWR